MKIRICAVLAACALSAAAPADAATYIGTRTLGAFSADISLTSNKIGSLTLADITAYQVTLRSAGGVLAPITLNSSNSALLLIGSALSATGTTLNFNFDGARTSYFLVQQGGAGNNQPYYCLETAGCTGQGELATPGGYETIAFFGTGPFVSPTFAPMTGTQTIATAMPASAVPEPATWAMMLAGFGLIGGATRYRRQKPQASFAAA